MKRVLLLTAFFAALCVWSLPASAADVTANIQKSYETIKGFTANFSQTLTNAASGEKDERTGVISFKKPVLIRWETGAPEKELLIVAKDAVWDYFEEDNEAFRYPVDEVINSKTMIRFLTGESKISEDFHVTEEKGDKPGIVKLTLVPKEPEPGLVEAIVWVDTKTWFLTRISIRDFYANGNDLRLSDIKIDPDLPDKMFTFVPPPGCMVFDNSAPEGKPLSQ